MTRRTHPLLSIVFLNFNRLDETRFTVSQLFELTKDRDDIEIIAVDNGSSDGTASFLASQKPKMRVLALDRNLGIGGLNRGFQMADGDYILVLDDDSHPVNVDTLDRIIQRFESQPDVGLVACRIEYPDGTCFKTWHLPSVETPGPSMAFVGCGFAIRRRLFERIGWFPEPFFLYQNEIETAIRVMQQGSDIYYDPCCRVVHRESRIGRTSWRQVYYPTRNTLWIIRRYFGWPQAMLMIGSRMLIGLARAAQSCQWRAYLSAVWAGLTANIHREPLSPILFSRLRTFRQHNNIICHLLGKFRFD